MHLVVYFFVVAVVWQNTFGFLEHSCDLDCNGHGSCHYGAFGKKYCRCDSGYIGDHCQTRSACNPNPCQHHGHCEGTHSSPYYKCTCNYGYLGDKCEHTHCASSPCKNGGTCHRKYSGSYYYCSCSDLYSGHDCEVPPPQASTVQPLDLKTTTSAGATTSPKIEQTCSKLSSVFDIAENVTETNQAATLCESGSHASPEAFVLNNCGLTPASTWTQGYNVMTWCKEIPPYTPIASFYQGLYDSINSITGIFVGCLKDSKGFTLAVQLCDQAANIVHIIAGNETSNMNPNNYFTIAL